MKSKITETLETTETIETREMSEKIKEMESLILGIRMFCAIFLSGILAIVLKIMFLIFDFFISTGIVVKYIIFICTLAVILYLSFSVFRTFLLKNKKIALKIVAVLLILFNLAICYSVSEYIYPFKREAKVTLVAEIELTGDERIGRWRVDKWQAIYEEYGLYPASYYFSYEFLGRKLNIEFPEMDLEKYTYIVTYGKKIKKLTYNPWVTILYGDGAAEGHIVFEEDFDNTKVYLYRLKRTRIDNPEIQ